MSIVERAKKILLNPKEEWEVIAKEEASVSGLFTGYAMILALIPLVMTVLFSGLLGLGAAGLGGGLGISLGIGYVVTSAVVGYAVGLGLLWLISFIVNAVVPSFNGKQDMVQATKLMVYAATPTWVVGLISWIPLLGALLAIAAMAYTVYLIYLGMKPVLAVPEEKVAGMTVVTVLIYIVASLVIFGVITTSIMGMFFSGALLGGALG